MNKNSLFFFTFLIITVVFNCTNFVAFSTILYVPDSTFSNIQSALDSASSGDTIMVAAGTYHENISISNLTSIISLIGAGYDQTNINGDSVSTVITANGVNGNIDILIEGLTITNGASGSYNTGGILINAGSPCCNQAINATIRYCNISNNSGYGIYIVNDNKGTSYIHDNIIAHNGSGFSRYLGTYYLYNNTIAYNTNNGYDDWAGGGNIYMINNIFAFNGKYGVYKHKDTPTNIAYNNNYGNVLGDYYWDYSNNPIVTIYPNPTKDYLTISSDKQIKNLEIFSYEGKLIYEELINANSKETDTKIGPMDFI